MKDITIDCFLSAKNNMNPNRRPHAFEFLGFDFMIDEDFRLWLIEININPYIGLYNDNMQHVLPNMFDGLFKITLDPLFEKQTYFESLNTWRGTDWDLLYSKE